MKIREGENIRVVEEGEEVFIHAPLVNKTVVKHGPFRLTGDEIELFAGEHIRITTASPNKLTISANVDKEKARIADLETRVKNLEKVIVSLIKKEKEDASSNGEGAQKVGPEETPNG